MIFNDKLLIFNQHWKYTPIDEGFVCSNPTNNELFKGGKLETIILDFIREQARDIPFNKLISILHNIYNTDQQTLTNDVTEFLINLIKKDVLIFLIHHLDLNQQEILIRIQ